MLTVIESPFAGEVAKNIEYARSCMRDSLRRGEDPYASHLLFTQPGILDDLVPEERKRGIEAGFNWGMKADLVAFYIDRGISSGMRLGLETAKRRGALITVRSLERDVTEIDYIALNLEFYPYLLKNDI